MPASGSSAVPDPSRLKLYLPVDAPDIAGLTRGVRNGNEASFERLYQLYCDRLYRYLLVVSRGQEELAREALQAAWTKAIQHLPSFDDEKKLWHWLATVARNTYFDALRRHQRSPIIIPLVDDQIATDETPPDDTLLFEHLEQCLTDLEPDERALVRGFYFEGQSHQQLAQWLNTTAKAVESKLARLRQALQRNLITRLSHEDS
jgi:RNA polymerase sigma-70 factor (ECF subfamily)